MPHAAKRNPCYAEPDEPEVGAVVGSYVLRSKIGAGGFGSVWLARDADGEAVAVKVLHANLVHYRGGAKGPTVADRFLSEARMLQELDHPGLVEVYEVIEDRDAALVAYVMEHLDGADLVRCEAELGLASILDMFAQVAETLDYLHQHGIVHRDIKPANILLTSPDAETDGRRRAKVIDLGIAKQVDSDMTATATGTLLGSVRSMAPETLLGPAGSITGAVDQWAFGVALFEILAGRRPFDGETMIDIVHLIERATPAPFALRPRFAGAQCEEALGEIVSRCLRRDPGDRFADLAAVGAALRAAIAVEPEPDRTLYDPNAPLMAVSVKHADTTDSDDATNVAAGTDTNDTVGVAVLSPSLESPRAIVEVNPSPVERLEPPSFVVHAETVGVRPAAVTLVRPAAEHDLDADVLSAAGVIAARPDLSRALVPIWLTALTAAAFITGIALGWLVRT